MQDDVPAHSLWEGNTSRTRTGNNPHLNPIENCQGLIKQQLQGINTATLLKLVKEIHDIWDTTLNDLCSKDLLNVFLDVW